MDIESLQNYCVAKKGVEIDFPFDAHTMAFKVLGKIFALVPLDAWEKGEACINLKADPDYSVELRSEYMSITPGFHMNKTHWNTIEIYKAGFPPGFLLKLVDHSYDCVLKSMTKKMRDTLL